MAVFSARSQEGLVYEGTFGCHTAHNTLRQVGYLPGAAAVCGIIRIGKALSEKKIDAIRRVAEVARGILECIPLASLVLCVVDHCIDYWETKKVVVALRAQLGEAGTNNSGGGTGMGAARMKAMRELVKDQTNELKQDLETQRAAFEEQLKKKQEEINTLAEEKRVWTDEKQALTTQLAHLAEVSKKTDVVPGEEAQKKITFLEQNKEFLLKREQQREKELLEVRQALQQEKDKRENEKLLHREDLAGARPDAGGGELELQRIVFDEQLRDLRAQLQEKARTLDTQVAQLSLIKEREESLVASNSQAERRITELQAQLVVAQQQKGKIKVRLKKRTLPETKADESKGDKKGLIKRKKKLQKETESQGKANTATEGSTTNEDPHSSAT